MSPRPRILIVEDEVAVATGLQWLLEAEGMTVHVVGLAAEVLAALDDFKPEVMLLDLSLPDANGREVYAWVKGRVPVIFSTGSFDELERMERIGTAKVEILMKPFTLEELLRSINRVLPPRASSE